MSYKPDNLPELYGFLERYYGGLHENLKRADRLYKKEFRDMKGLPELPESVPVHEPATARNLVDNLADQIRTDEPVVVFKARGATKKALEHKDLMEMWGRAALMELSRHSLIDPTEQSKTDLLLRSAACVKFLARLDLLPDPPEPGSPASAFKEWRLARATVWPWVIRPLDPLTVYPAPGTLRPPAFVLEKQTRTVQAVKDEYPLWSDPKGRGGSRYDPTREVEWLEFWSPDWYMVSADGELVIDKQNPYRLAPYIFIYAGMGRNDYTGDPRYLGVSVLDGILGELEAEVRIKTAADAQWQQFVFPTIYVDATEDAGLMAQAYRQGPGRVIQVKDISRRPQEHRREPPSPEMMRFLAEVKGSIAERFPPELMRRPAGVEAAIHQALLIGQAMKPLVRVKRALNTLYSDLLNGMAQIAARMQLDMAVTGFGLEADKERLVSHTDFTTFTFEVKFEATDPSEDDRRMLAGLAVLRASRPGELPIMSRQTYREHFAPRVMPNNEEEEERVLTEQAMSHPAMIDVLVRAVLERAGAIQEEAGREGLEEEMAGRVKQMMAGGGVPPQAAAVPPPGARERGAEALTGGGRIPTQAQAREGFETEEV